LEEESEKDEQSDGNPKPELSTQKKQKRKLFRRLFGKRSTKSIEVVQPQQMIEV
jgi:hypothetical protein